MDGCIVASNQQAASRNAVPEHNNWRIAVTEFMNIASVFREREFRMLAVFRMLQCIHRMLVASMLLAFTGKLVGCNHPCLQFSGMLHAGCIHAACNNSNSTETATTTACSKAERLRNNSIFRRINFRIVRTF